MSGLLAGAVPRFSRHPVNRLHSVAHLFPRAERCGVYILSFTNGERYVGQSVNIVTRFGAHRRTWDDIEFLDFSPCPRARLDGLERTMITGQRDAGHRLRNITHALGPLGDSDLDPLVTPAEQYSWLNDGAIQLGTAARAEDPEQRRRHRPNY